MSRQPKRWTAFTGSGDNVYELLPEPRKRKPMKQIGKTGSPALGSTIPPPLPPPRATPPMKPRNLSAAGTAPPLAQPLPLSTIVANYPNCFPIQVKVHNGYYGNTTELVISQDEVFNLHFVKRTKVVILKYDNEKELSLPLYSAVEFAVVYDPNENEAEAKAGFVFDTAAELVAMKPLPLVVKATKSYKGSSPESSVEAGELLQLMGVKTSSFPGRGKQLQARSLKDGGQEKQLHEKCAGGFSTKPSETRITLPMIHHSLPYPQTVMVFPDKELDKLLPSSIANDKVTLEGCREETSVIATRVSSEEPSTLDGEEEEFVLDIHLSLEIEVESVPLGEGAQLKLGDDTLALYRNFDVKNAQVYVEKPNSKIYDLQSLLYKRTGKVDDSDRYQLLWPVSLDEESSGSDFCDSLGTGTSPLLRQHRREPAPTPPLHRSLSPLEFEMFTPPQPLKDVAGSVYEPLDPSLVKREENAYTGTTATPVPKRSPVQPSTSTMEQPDTNSQQSPEFETKLKRDVEQEEGDQEKSTESFKFEKELANLKTQVTELGSKMDKKIEALELADTEAVEAIRKVNLICERLQEELQQLASKIAPTPNPPENGEVKPHVQELASGQPPPSADAIAENKEILALLDCNEVLSLLDAMNLSQYKEAFQYEQVNGELLLECDEDILENELHVSSRIHRIRFIKIISGKVSVQNMLNKNATPTSSTPH